jgi:hypothetical protein
MRAGRGKLLAVTLAIGLLPAALHAQAGPSKAQLDNAAFVLRIISSALQSNEVEQPVKNKLFECLYSNSVSQVSAAVDKVVAANPGKVDRKDPSQMLAVIAGACGYRPAAAAKPAPQK